MNTGTERKIDDESRDRLLDWFRNNKRELPWRREDRSPYIIWVSEVMLQQTRVDTVIPYFERFMERFPSVEDLSGAAEEDVLNMWEGLGFYARARNLHKTANILVREYEGTFPETREELEELPGIGPSTAAAITSFAFQKPVPYLDGNVFRVISRYTGFTENTETEEGRTFVRSVVRESMPAKNPGLFNEALIELGAKICTPSDPDCGKCPLRTGCLARRNEIQEQLPYRGEKREVPTRTRTAVVVRRNGKMLLIRRPSSGLLGGMWELPALWNREEETLLATARRTGIWAVGEAKDLRKIPNTVTHKYSHFHLRMPIFRLTVDDPEEQDDLWTSGWYDSAQLSDIPIHRAAQKAIETVGFQEGK